MKQNIIFQHGFGFSNNFWQNILPYFEDFNCHLIDSNYFSTKNNNEKNLIQVDENYIGVGHSLGFLKLYKNFPNIKKIIGINAFSNFLGSQKDIYKTRIKEYNLFQIQFNKNPYRLIHNFHLKCGIKNYYIDKDSLNIENLKNDLALLKSNINILTNKETLIINSIDDIIVPINITKDNFNKNNIQVNLMPKGKHALGFLYAKEIAKLILDFI